MFNFGKKKKSPTNTRELAKELKALEKRLQEVTEEVTSLKEAHKKALTKVGLVRFNPFGEIGGDQSFSAALLDEEDSGIVLTSHYGKDMQRVYAKPVTKGKPEYSLSTEEEEALEQAKNKS